MMRIFRSSSSRERSRNIRLAIVGVLAISLVVVCWQSVYVYSLATTFATWRIRRWRDFPIDLGYFAFDFITLAVLSRSRPKLKFGTSFPLWISAVVAAVLSTNAVLSTAEDVTPWLINLGTLLIAASVYLAYPSNS